MAKRLTIHEMLETHSAEPAALSRVLLGEVITWVVKGKNLAFSAIITAMQSSNLDPNAARALAPRNAFSRACRELTEKRIIRKIDETNEILRFQFTREIDMGNGIGFDYRKETILTLDKDTGYVLCPMSALQTEAQALLDHNIAHRTGADVTRIVQKLFEQRADLFAIRDQGGAYFVPIEHQEFVERVEQFIIALGGKMKRFPVPCGYKTGEDAARDAIARGLDELILEHEKAIDELDNDTRQSTFKRRAERIKETKFKIESYYEYLGDRQERLKDRLDQASNRLQHKIETLASIDENEALPQAV